MSFPKSARKQKHVEEVLQREEEAFNKTLDTRHRIFNEASFDTEATGKVAIWQDHDDERMLSVATSPSNSTTPTASRST